MPSPSVAVVRTTGGVDAASGSGASSSMAVKLLLQAVGAFAFGFVQHENIRDFHQAGLHTLHVVAQARHHQHQRAFGQPHDVDFVLTDADGFDQHNLLARGIEHQRRRRPWRAPVRQEIRAWPWSE